MRSDSIFGVLFLASIFLLYPFLVSCETAGVKGLSRDVASDTVVDEFQGLGGSERAFLSAARDLDYDRLVTLVEEGANINAQSFFMKYTALMYAVEDGRYTGERIVKYLSKLPGINPNLRNRNGDTVLMLAIKKRVEYKHVKYTADRKGRIIKSLLSIPTIDANARDAKFRSPIILSVVAAGNYFIDPSFSLLMDSVRRLNIDINAQDEDGMNALMYSVIERQQRKFIELIEHPDTNRSLANNNGDTALSLATAALTEAETELTRMMKAELDE